MKPKFVGRDAEFSTTGIDARGRSISPGRVTAAILRQIRPSFLERGANAWARGDQFHSASMDCLRNWTPGGQCYYADMAHVEGCTASCHDPLEFAAQSWHLLQAVEAARMRAEVEAEHGSQYSLTTANVDLCNPDISFGTHLSVSVEPHLWNELFHLDRYPARLAMVASALAAAIVFFGAGYLIPRRGRVEYSLSARVHHLSRLISATTTLAYQRGILNSRREAHGEGQERVHIIGFDYCPISSELLCSFLQCLFASAEEGFASLQLLDPLGACHAWARGLDLQTGRMPVAANLVDGRRLTLPQFLRELTTILFKMCESGFIPEHIAPRARQLLPQILELTHYAEEGSIDRCGRHLTWASKLLWLIQRQQQTGQSFSHAEMRLADHDFSNTDPQRGCIWWLLEQEMIEPMVSQQQIDQCWLHGPASSRDYARGQLIQRFSDRITDVNWSYLDLRRGPEIHSPRVRIQFRHLDCMNRDSFESLLGDAVTVDDVVQRLE